jgi:mitogen-activated protein kinase 15
MREFRGTEDEKVMPHVVTIPFNDNKKFTIKDYRDALYNGVT